MSGASGAAGGVFISYRRDDAAYPASWLFDLLVDRYGKDRVFKDVDSIPLGDDFVKVITAAVQSCTVLLAVIGKGWLDAADQAGRRRLDDRDDFVRLEIEAALKRDVRVVPILVDGARMPRAAQLPSVLKELAHREALELGPNRFNADSQPLLNALDGILATVVTRTSAMQAANLPSLEYGTAPLPLEGNDADLGGGLNTPAGFPPGFDPEWRLPPGSAAEVAERQAQIQADLKQAQEIIAQTGDGKRWSRTMQEVWQQNEPEVMRKLLEMQNRPEGSSDELSGGDSDPARS